MKALIVLIVVLILGFMGFAGFWLLQQMNGTEEADASSSQPRVASAILSNMKPPEDDADALDKLDYALKQSEDVVAWIEIPGTDIKNLVMQADDNYYYERRNEDGQEEVYGCYFADYECAIGTPDVLFPNTVIYGHSDLKDNPDGPRFSQLFRFTDEQFARDYQYISLTLPEGKLYWQIFSVFYTDVNFNYIKVQMTPEEMVALAQQAISLSVHDYGIPITADDKLLTLSTCSVRDGDDGSHRFVVMAKLCPPGFEPPLPRKKSPVSAVASAAEQDMEIQAEED